MKPLLSFLRLAWIPGGFFALHAWALASTATTPALALLVSQFFVGTASVLAIAAAIRRCRTSGWRPSDGWSLIALAFGFWTMAIGSLFVLVILALAGVDMALLVEKGLQLTVHFTTAFFALYAVPLTWLIATPFRHRDTLSIQLVDALLATALGVLFCALTVMLIEDAGLGTRMAERNMMLLYDVENLFLLGGFALRYWAASSVAERRLFGPLLVYAALYLVVVGFYNHFVMQHLQLRRGTYFDLLAPLPFTLFAAVVFMPGSAPCAPRRAMALRSRYVRSASPLLLCAAVLATSLALARYHFVGGAIGVGLAVAGYGLRTVLREVRQREQRTQQRSQHLAVQALSLTDGLTGIPNRRAFDQAFEREWKGCLRSGRPLGVLMMDIDHFKLLNDTSGHQAGDLCLQQVAQALRGALNRPGDMLARYGGEEFVVLLPDTDELGCEGVAETLRQAVFDLDLPNTGTPGGRLTISIGVACEALRQDRGRARLLRSADKAVYVAKKAGRNRVVSAWEAAAALGTDWRDSSTLVGDVGDAAPGVGEPGTR